MRFHCLRISKFVWLGIIIYAGDVLAAGPIGLPAIEQLQAASLLRPGVRTYQCSSHEPTGGNGDANNYLQNIGGELVLLDVKGPGCIYRMWWFGDNAASRNIHIYFDGAATPLVNMPVDQFFLGTHAPFLTPLVGNGTVSSAGNYCYLPMPFRTGCKIALTGATITNYYNITFQRFADATGVTTFTGTENSTTARNVWNTAGTDPKPDHGSTVLTNTINLTNGSTATLANIATGGTIQELVLTIPSLNDNMLTTVRLRAKWDGAADFAIDVPMGYFLACGLGVRNIHALPVGNDTATHKLYCYLPMPFGSSALVQLVNNSGQTISSLNYNVRYTPQSSGLQGAGYLNAKYLSEVPTTNGRDYTILNETGAGQFVGVVQTLHNPVNDLIFLEGDERIYVDGSLTPQIQGTGTEDCYNGAAYFNGGPFILPVHGYPMFSNAAGVALAVYRFFLSDTIPFTNAIKVALEHNVDNQGTPNYYSVAFYYKLPSGVGGSTLTDTVDVGNTASESAHSYVINSPTFVGSTSGNYEGDDDDVVITDDGRRHAGYSQFVAAINPANDGLLLRRRMDYSLPLQDALVYIDGIPAGEWYDAGSNGFKIFRDAEFMVPASLTHGKTSTTIKIVNLSTESNWTEYRYWVYSLAPTQEISIDMGSSDVVNGLTHLQVGGDGNTTALNIGGRNCRSNVNPGSDFFFYFDVTDSYAFQGSRPDLYIIVEYYDTGTSTITLDYDSSTGTGTSASYRFGGGVTLTNTNTWKTKTYHVTDAYFGNRENAGADFRIADINNTFYLDRVWVTTQAPLPPIITGVNPIQFTFQNVPYNQQLVLTQANPWPTWSLLQGPPGTQVSSTGLVNGWTPPPGSIGDYSFTVQAINSQGSDTKNWVVRVLSRLDFDQDGDVDLSDFGHFQQCLSGDGVPYAAGCADADTNGDGDVDTADFNAFLPCLAGANVPPGC